MPRARMIKPGFFTNEDVVCLPPETQLLFIGLWTLADKEGRLEDRPFRIKMQIFPAADYDVSRMLDDLQAASLIVRYSVAGQRYIWIPKFETHQNPHPNEAASVIPAYVEGKTEQCNYTSGNVKDESARALTSSSLSSLTSDTSTSDTRETHMSSLRSTGDGDEQEVFTHWQQTTGHQSAKYTPKRKKAVRARLKDGYSVDQLKRAINGVLLSPHHQGKNDTGTVYDDLELICRDGEHVERFERIANGIGIRGSPGNGRFSQTRNTANNDKVIDEWVQKGAVNDSQ